MKDTPEINESPEKKITKTPEKKIDTFDDLKASDNSGRINTFDDLRKQESDSSIKTFDDLRGGKEVGDKTKSADTTDKAVKDTPGLTEQKRIDQATEDIKKNELMQPEKWKTLSIEDKRMALDHSGKALGKAYETPEPPLTTKKMEAPGLQGEYGDGYKYDHQRDKYNGHVEVNPNDFKGHGIAGADYGIEMNEKGMDPNTHKKLFGEDPREALETYGHEFRHSYQHEQANAFDKGFKTDDTVKAKKWSENLKNYQQPPDSELAKTDPEKYFREFETYRNQPVEKDAREFGNKLSNSVYGNNESIER